MNASAGESKLNENHRAAAALTLYRESLLRSVAAKLVRPRTQYAPDDLRERMLGALDDPVGLDRTLKQISPAARRILRLIDLSRQPRWTVQSLADLLPMVGHIEGGSPILELLEAGMLYPELMYGLPIESFTTWLEQATFDPIAVTVVPLAAQRCRGEPLDWNAPAGEKTKLDPIEADGLEWILRGAVVWQLVRAAPLRRTQTGGLFKRDQDRLRSNALLSAPVPDAPAAANDLALLAAELSRCLGIVDPQGDEWNAGTLPAEWAAGLAPAIAELWTALNAGISWDPSRGYDPDLLARRWLPALGAALVAALVDAPPANWHDTAELAQWLAAQQPDAANNIGNLSDWCAAYLLGVLHPLRLVEAAKVAEGYRLRLSAPGRAILSGDPPPGLAPTVLQTLLVQPNLDMIVYRQGLTPALIATLSRFAEWKVIGLACTLTLTPESVYGGLESGLSQAEIQRTLERHSTRHLTDSVIETLRSWASKRERVQVFPAAVLLEFRTAADLDSAAKQGLVEQKLTDRIGLVSGEEDVDYSRFRLVGARDYLAAEERCVDASDDGLVLTIADGKSDLLLNAEARRFADPAENGPDDRTRLRLSISSLQRAKESGVDLRWLEDWFRRRTGASVPPTAKLLFLGAAVGSMALESTTVLHVPSGEVADGIERWPAAQPFLAARLGPTAFAVKSDGIAELTQLLKDCGIEIS